MTDEPAPVTQGACRNGPTIPLTDAGGDPMYECVVCGATLARDNAFWFGIVCDGGDDADT